MRAAFTTHWLHALVVLAASTQANAQNQQPGSPDRPPLAEGRPGETLSETLERNEGVIKPPPVDPEMASPPPPVGARTPVIEPPAPPQHNPPSQPER